MFYGKTKALAVWKEALSDQELADLTYPTPTDPTFTLDFDTIAEQFTFARGSEATYVDAQGLIKSTNELGEELITNGDFSNGSTDWTLGTGWTISGGTANYDGLQAYQLLRQGTANGVIGKTYIVKYDVSNNNGVGGIIAKFGGVNLSSYNSNNGSFEYYVDAISTDYIRFTPQLDFNGSIDNVSVKEVISATNTPRLDYSTGAEAFLLEPQTTQLVPYSEALTSGSWGASVGTTPTLESGYSAPDGTNNAFKISNANQDSAWVYSGIVLGTSSRSIYARTVSGTGTAQLLSHNSNTNNTFTITEQWQRFDVNTANSTGNTIFYAVDFRGSGTLSELIIWGANATNDQDYATSYIPSNGSQTTRNQETCINATPEINSEEGVLYFEGGTLA